MPAFAQFVTSAGTAPGLCLMSNAPGTAASWQACPSGGGGGGSGGRLMLTANTTVYVNCATGNDSNPGTAALPFATPYKAYTHVQQTYDLAGYIVTAQLQTSCSEVVTTVYGPLVGAKGAGSFIFQGQVGSPNVIAIEATGTYAFLFFAQQDAQFTVQWMRLKSVNGGAILVGQGVVNVGNVYWDAAGHSHMDAAGPRSIINSFGNNTVLITGNTNIHAVAEDHALITMAQHTEFSACPAFYTAFVQGDLGGMIDATGFTWGNGCPQGKRFNAISNGIVFTGTGSAPANFFPGSVAGTVNTGGIYQ